MNQFQDYVIVDFGDCKDIFTKKEWYGSRQFEYKDRAIQVWVGPDFNAEAKSLSVATSQIAMSGDEIRLWREVLHIVKTHGGIDLNYGAIMMELRERFNITRISK